MNQKIRGEMSESEIIKTREFFKEAFCIDGEAEIVGSNNMEIKGVIKMTDSQRGTFFVAVVEPEKIPKDYILLPVSEIEGLMKKWKRLLDWSLDAKSVAYERCLAQLTQLLENKGWKKKGPCDGK